MENIVPEQIANNDPQPAPIEEMQAPETEKSKILVTIGTVERIGLVMRNTIAQAAHPKLKFTPEWQDRSFTIALETDGYVAVASVNPFNHKKQ